MNILHEKGVPEFLIKELEFYSSKIQDLVAYTIMPDHIHLLVEVDLIEHLSYFLRDFKKFTSIKIKEQLLLQAPHVWQRGTMDHCIRIEKDENDYLNHLAYIFYNCEKHLNIMPKDFAYHNFLEFVDKGYFNLDFHMFNDSKFRYE